MTTSSSAKSTKRLAAISSGQSKNEVSAGLSQPKKPSAASRKIRVKMTKATMTTAETKNTGLWMSRPMMRTLSCPTS